MQDMTIKQIAEICQVAERTIRDWVAKASAKSADLSVKSAEVKTGVGYKFTLPETLAIIRAGGRSTLADLLQENAQRSQPAITDTIRELIPVITATVTAAMTPLIQKLQTLGPPTRYRQATLALPAATPGSEYYTIKAYGSMHGVRVNNTSAVMLGREASRLSRERNIEIRKVPHEEWGEINSYHISVLKEVFTV